MGDDKIIKDVIRISKWSANILCVAGDYETTCNFDLNFRNLSIDQTRVHFRKITAGTTELYWVS